MKKHNVTLSKIQIDQMNKKAVYMGQEIGLRWATIFIAHQLHEKYGFGKQRLQEIKNGLSKWADMVNDGTVDGRDMDEWAKSMGLNFDE